MTPHSLRIGAILVAFAATGRAVQPESCAATSAIIEVPSTNTDQSLDAGVLRP